MVLEKTGRILRVETRAPATRAEDSLSAEDDEDEPVEEVQIMQEVATFESLTVWGHDVAPAEVDDSYVKGIQEWMSFSHAVSLFWPFMYIEC